MYQKAIAEILESIKAPAGLTPAMVEAFMRLEYGTLDHLPNSRFIEESKMCADEAKADPDFIPEMQLCAESYGL